MEFQKTHFRHLLIHIITNKCVFFVCCVHLILINTILDNKIRWTLNEEAQTGMVIIFDELYMYNRVRVRNSSFCRLFFRLVNCQRL